MVSCIQSFAECHRTHHSIWSLLLQTTKKYNTIIKVSILLKHITQSFELLSRLFYKLRFDILPQHNLPNHQITTSVLRIRRVLHFPQNISISGRTMKYLMVGVTILSMITRCLNLTINLNTVLTPWIFHTLTNKNEVKSRVRYIVYLIQLRMMVILYFLSLLDIETISYVLLSVYSYKYFCKV